MADLNWSDVGSAARDIFGGIGGLVAAGGSERAAEISEANAALAVRKTAIQQQQSERAAFKLIGGMHSDIAAAGFSLSGTAIDLMADSARQASLDSALISNAGLIEQNQFLAEAEAYKAQAQASEMSGIGSFLSAGAKIASIAVALSDERVKTDIETSYFDDAGRRWVNFRYNWDAPTVRRHGVIAQEIQQSDPHAVSVDPKTGLLLVDYSKLAA